MQPGQLSTLFYQGSTELMNRWQNQVMLQHPRMRWSSSMTTLDQITLRCTYDGDFVRLRDLTVNYNFPLNDWRIRIGQVKRLC